MADRAEREHLHDRVERQEYRCMLMPRGNLLWCNTDHRSGYSHVARISVGDETLEASDYRPGTVVQIELVVQPPPERPRG